MNEEIIETGEVIERPIGIGYAIADKEDLEKYESYISEDLSLYDLFYVFFNDMPYYIGDATVVIQNKLTKELIPINETVVIRFEEFPLVMLKTQDEKYLDFKRMIQ